MSVLRQRKSAADRCSSQEGKETMADVQKLSLRGISISKEDALELVNRMNQCWPGEYVLEWSEAPYANNAINPLSTLDSSYNNQYSNAMYQ